MSIPATRSSGPTLTIGLANFARTPPPDGWSHLRDAAQAADGAGVDRLVVVDHVVLGEHLDAYDGGTFPTEPAAPWLEPLTTLSVLAGITTRVRLATGILIAALRRPVVLAKTAATLDVLSGGRLDLGVGVGWQREEYDAAGLAFAERGRLLDETLAVCQALWTGRPAAYHSPHLDFDSVWCEPRPMRAGGVPIWIAGRMHARTVERIIRFGSGWIPWGDDRVDVAPGIDRLRQALSEAGRDPDQLEVRGELPIVSTPEDGIDLDGTMEPVQRLTQLGVTDFRFGLPRRQLDDLGGLVAAFRDTAGRAR